MGMVVVVPEGPGDDIKDEIETYYDDLMENAEELLIVDGDAAEKDVAAISFYIIIDIEIAASLRSS